MKQKHKLTPQEQQELSQTHSQQAAVREFASTEELLRADASQIEVPPAVAKRLDESISREPKPSRSWWRRLTGG